MTTAECARRSRKLTLEFKRHVDHRFTGSNTAAIIWFLDLFVRGDNYINVNEGDTVWIIAD